MKKIAIVLLLVTAILVFSFSKESNETTTPESIDRQSLESETTRLYIDTDNESNSTVVFNCYMPTRKIDEKLPLLIVVGGGQNIKGDNFTTGSWKEKAEKGRFIIIAPSFKGDDDDYAQKSSFEYPSQWAGKAIKDAVAMINTTYPIDSSNINIFGHSSGAQLAHRFVLQNDGYIRKAAIHAPGQVTLATKAISTNLFVTLGENDTTRKKKVLKFIESCENNGIDVEYKEYPGVGHMISPDQIEDSFKFFNY